MLWNEDQFIDTIAQQFSVQKPLIGIGDDCAVIPRDDKTAWLITTDALVEGVHFLKEQIKASDLGFKTIAVNVSDIAAMGGSPQYAFLSIAIPKTTDTSWAHLFIEGIKEACLKWNIILLGGDTVGSKRDIFINLTLIGAAAQNHIKYRHQAQTGDVICINGYLGNSGGGFKALQNNLPLTGDIEHLIQSHFRPQPSPEQGQWLASQSHVHAMMDISDGLDCDLKRLLKQSKKGAVIETLSIPLSKSLENVSSEQGWDALEFALVGGEDYCLLFTVSSKDYDAIQCAFQDQFHNPLFAIGYVTDHNNDLIYHKKSEVIHIHYETYKHF